MKLKISYLWNGIKQIFLGAVFAIKREKEIFGNGR